MTKSAAISNIIKAHNLTIIFIPVPPNEDFLICPTPFFYDDVGGWRLKNNDCVRARVPPYANGSFRRAYA